jgi:hypothetical protein
MAGISRCGNWRQRTGPGVEEMKGNPPTPNILSGSGLGMIVVLDRVVAGDEYVGDQRRREQAVLDDAGGGAEQRRQAREVVVGTVARSTWTP